MTSTRDQPSGANSLRTSSAPPLAGRAGTSIRSGNGLAARSGMARQTPPSADLKTAARATDNSEDAA